MKIILNIAKTELRDLFYSPIAWLILVIFSFQSGILIAEEVSEIVKTQAIGYYSSNLTMNVFGGWRGVFVRVQSYLYLYIPILTMSIMSRELGSGSIKLLYSSPVTNIQIILGKYIGMLTYIVILMGILILYAIFGIVTIEHFDVPLILSGLLGMFLLLSTYVAIGLFMSSLTSYQIVAAIGTLAILSILEHIGNVWQHIEFVREITYWLEISGRARNFMRGMIGSEDIIYFITVISLFLGVTLIRLQLRRQRVSKLGIVCRFGGIFVAVILIATISARPKWQAYLDATATKQNTITPNSQDVVAQLTDGLKITTYVNILDQSSTRILTGYSEDVRRFEQYTRFKPEIELEYVYYYDKVPNQYLDVLYPNTTMEEKAEKVMKNYKLNPKKVLTPEQIRARINLTSEGNRLVRVLERENGEKTFLRMYNDMEVFPVESEISVAMKRLTTSDIPTIGFLTGHGERVTDRSGERSYSQFTRSKNVRHALVNQGFDCRTVTLDKDIPADVNILVVAEMKKNLTEEEHRYFMNYLERGGNMMLIGDIGCQEVMNTLTEPVGVKFMDGYLIQHLQRKTRAKDRIKSDSLTAESSGKPLDLLILRPTEDALNISYIFNSVIAALPGATGLDYSKAGEKGFRVTPLLATDSQSWNELETQDYINEAVVYNPDCGEIQQVHTVALALSRQQNGKEQKIVVLSDADALSNENIARPRMGYEIANSGIATGSFHWMSDGEFPIDVRRLRPLDSKLALTEDSFVLFKYAVVGGIPILLILAAIGIWFRRRRH